MSPLPGNQHSHPSLDAPAASAPIPAPIADASPASLLPMGLLMLRQLGEAQFAEATALWLSQFNPADLVGRLHAEAVVLAAARLRKAAQLEPEGELPGLDWCRFQALAERNYRNACKDLARHFAPKRSEADAPKPRKSSSSRSSETAPPPPPPPPESSPEEIAEAAAHWRKRIALIPSMSDEWPILLRLGIEVEDVSAWLDAGKSEEELMRWYPGLNRADIAACRACDLEGLCGPFDTADGPYPPGLPILDRLPEIDPKPGP